MAVSSKKILILGSYPIVQPRHGGQKRVQAIVQEYQKHFAQVKYVAVFSRWAYPTYARTDIAVGHKTDRAIMESSKVEDIVTGGSIFSEPGVKKRMTRLLTTYRPDIIQVEQAYPYIGLQPLLEELSLNPQIVFDAHNVESKMKKVIYNDTGIYQGAALDRAAADALVGQLEQLEQSLIERAALTIAVSPADAEVYESLGASNLVLARNGIYHSVPTANAVKHWQKVFADNNIRRGMLFVASAHLPNWTGFQDVVGEELGFLRPDERILLAGGLSDYLMKRHEWRATPGAATFWCRAMACGLLSEDMLAGLITSSESIILPITSGGGSNLKTAEALLSGKPIIATSYAFRAYENFASLPTVTITDDPDEFRAAMTKPTKASSLTSAQQHELSQVTWPSTLANLVKEMVQI